IPNRPVYVDYASLKHPAPGRILQPWVSEEVHIAGNAHRGAALHNAGHHELPAAGEFACQSVRRVQESPPRSERQLIDGSERQTVRAVPCGKRIGRRIVLAVEVAQRFDVLRQSVGHYEREAEGITLLQLELKGVVPDAA